MRRCLAVLTVALAASLHAPGAGAGEPTVTAADATESGRRLDRALDIVLDGTTRQGAEPRTLAFLVDPSASLRGIGFPDRLEAAFRRHAAKLGATQVALAGVGSRDPFLVPPSRDAAPVLRRVREEVAGAKDTIRNVYTDARALAGALGGRAGAREVVLVTLENGDAEDDLEATVRALDRARVRCFVITQEAFLADSWFASHGGKAPPRDATFTGGDAAFHDVPWGWVFQLAQGHEQVGSGFAPFGLSRLASGTGGRVFLVQDSSAPAHSCGTYASCLWCTGDHLTPSAAYQPARLRALAPLVGPRDDVLAAVAKDPWYRAAFAAWRKASDAGLVRSKPSLEIAGGAAKPARETGGAWATLTGNGLSFAGYAARAGKALEACERIRRELEAETKRIGPDAGLARGRAIAEHVRLMLLLTRANLVQYVGWCQEAGPVLTAKGVEAVPPEVPWYSADHRFVGVGYSNWSLCHGVKPFREAFLPGGPALADALADLDAAFAAYLARFDGTPFGAAVRRQGIARFHPTVQGKPIPYDERRRGNQPDTPPPTTNDRPVREGGGSTTGGGATTGGD